MRRSVQPASPRRLILSGLTQWLAGALIADFTIVCNSPLS